MEYSTPTTTGRAVAIIAGTISFVSWYMGSYVAEGFDIVFLIAVGALTGLIYIGVCTFHNSVVVDAATSVVKGSLGALLWSREMSFSMTGFRQVGIATDGRSTAHGGSTTVYFVDL